ncbi:MAG: lipoate--protein ligase family protein, partial [Candidatus Dormiibacterota bacterium]
RLIRIGRDRVSQAGVRSAEKRVSPLARWTSLSRDEVQSRLLAWFAALAPTRPVRLDEETLGDSRRLAERTYARADWIDRLH